MSREPQTSCLARGLCLRALPPAVSAGFTDSNGLQKPLFSTEVTLDMGSIGVPNSQLGD